MIKELFESFNGVNVLVIGDVMIDSYLWGKIERISPEAPVPIVSVTKKENRLGGAANVALNLRAMGANPILCSVIGDDESAVQLIELLKDIHISSEGILKVKDRITTVKTRVIGHHQHILRVDEEMDHELKEVETEQLLQKINQLIGKYKIEAIVFEDYDKGVITPLLIEKTVQLSQQKNIPVVVDPKKRNFLQYKNVDLFKPNLKELKEGLKIDFDHTDLNELRSAAQKLKDLLNAKMVMITLSENGIFIMDHENDYHIPAHIRNISDVSGAGDTVISLASLSLAKGTPTRLCAALSNLAGGLVCEKVGVVPINKQSLLKEALLLE
jgi:D-glycero-beta-D-manno-heptose-7-phosphate kinase